MIFGNNIINWYEINKRDLPWRLTSDPYKIWLSEVLLQQTRVDQGMGYYNRFVEAYPTVQDLANAKEEQVLKLWQGLGYYSRARNLHFAAQQVVNDFAGVFPSTYKEILNLKGVGDYTASAIASICFGEEVAVVDGNVYRVLSRFLKIETPIDSTEGKKEFKKVAMSLIKGHNPNQFNQGVMELGATICSPKKPQCEECPLNQSCLSFSTNEMLNYPVKVKKIKQRVRYFNYLVIADKEDIYIEQRLGKGIWQNMFQFPLLETDKEMEEWKEEIEGLRLESVSLPVKHILSHQKIFAKFWELRIEDSSFKSLSSWLKIKLEDIESKPIPKLIDNYITKRVH